MNVHARVRHSLSLENCVMAVTLMEEGRSQRYIADRLGVTQSAVSYVLKRYRENRDHQRRPGQGRRRVTNAVQDRYMVQQVLRNRTLTAPELQNVVRRTYGIQISSNTIRRRLRGRNLTPRIPARGPRLTAEHRRNRLQFARMHVNWEPADWSRVLFSDETRFSLYHSDRRVRVYRRPGERYAQCNFVENIRHGGGSVMFWGGVSLGGRTELVALREGNVNAVRYIADILEPHVVPYAENFGADFIFMQDNARPHTAQITQNFLRHENIETMNWPANSPDLNPIENLWDMMGRRFRALPNPPANLDELTVAISEIWNDIDQADMRTLILSMRRRCEAVIQARGGNTRY